MNKIPSDKIKMDGREYPFHFGVGAIYLLGLELEMDDIKVVDLDSVMTELKLSQIPIFARCGFLSGASKTGRDIEKVLTVDEIADKLKKDPYVLDQIWTIANEIKEQYAEDLEGNPQEAKGKK